MAIQGYKIVCRDCDHTERIGSAVLSSFEEMKLLFPEQNITTNLLYKWCGGILSKQTISRVLRENYKIQGRGLAAYYE
jgi:hypothetical protein